MSHDAIKGKSNRTKRKQIEIGIFKSWKNSVATRFYHRKAIPEQISHFLLSSVYL